MGGFYDTDDSPAAAAVVDQYIDNNLLGQKDIRKKHEKRKITDYGPNEPDRISELEDRLAIVEDSRKRSRQQQASFFGDSLISLAFGSRNLLVASNLMQTGFIRTHLRGFPAMMMIKDLHY